MRGVEVGGAGGTAERLRHPGPLQLAVAVPPTAVATERPLSTFAFDIALEQRALLIEVSLAPLDGDLGIDRGARSGDVQVAAIRDELTLDPVQRAVRDDASTTIFVDEAQPNHDAKARDDQRDASAAIAIIVTQAMPADIKHFGLKDGLWVCAWPYAATLGAAVRAGLVEAAIARRASEGRGEKMQMLYDYLTGSEFRNRVGGFVDAFREMQEQLEKEKRMISSRGIAARR